MFIKCAVCLSRKNTFACIILLTQRHASVINKTELLSSDRLLRLFIFKLLTFLCGKANPVLFVSVTAVLERQWVICRGKKPVKHPLLFSANYLWFLASHSVTFQSNNVLFSFSVFLFALSFVKDSKHINYLDSWFQTSLWVTF